MLRPFDLLLDDIPAELGRKTVQFVARGFVDDDVAGFRIAVTHDLVSRNRFAAFRYLELGRFRLFFGRVRCIRRRFARVVDSRRVVALLVLLFVDEKGPELEYLAFGVYFQDFVEVLQVDDAGSDLAVQLLLVVAFVYRDDLAQDTAAELDIQRFHLLVEHLHTPLDVVLAFALQEAFDRLLGLGRGRYFEPFGLGAGVVGRDDLDLVAAVDLRGDRFEFVVDLGADGAVADLRVDVVCEVERRSAERHFSGLAFWCKHHYFRGIQR